MEEVKTKVCTKCGIPKPLSKFYLRTNSIKYKAECKECLKNRCREYKKNHPDIIKAIEKKFNESEHGKEFWIEYKQSGKRKEAQHKYNTSEKGKASVKKYNELGNGKNAKRKYAKSEKGIVAEKAKLISRKQRYLTDPAYNLLIRLRRRINHAVHNANTYKCNNTVTCIGCTSAELKTYIESLFTPEMTWEKVLSGEIQIDHKVPCASFDLTDPEQQKQCFHYTNLQPLWETTRVIDSIIYIGNLNKGEKQL
jgi:hypothetical protein